MKTVTGGSYIPRPPGKHKIRFGGWVEHACALRHICKILLLSSAACLTCSNVFRQRLMCAENPQFCYDSKRVLMVSRILDAETEAHHETSFSCF
jgi:hypothetical protein